MSRPPADEQHDEPMSGATNASTPTSGSGGGTTTAGASRQINPLLAPSFAALWRFLAVALPMLAALIAPMPAVDLTYQLRAGAEILANKAIPTVDTWTFTAVGTPWLDQQWGAQVILAAAYDVAGWTGLALLRAGLVGLTFALLLVAVRSAWSRASVRSGGSAVASSARTATLVVLLFFIVASPALALRPQLLAIVLFAATLVVLVQRAEHPRRLWLIPAFAAAWANVHGTFPLVLVLVGLAWLDEVTLLREPTPAGHPRQPLPRRLLGSTGLAIIGAFAAVATLLTPYGIDVWRYIQNVARNPAVTSSQISEWQPPSPLDPAGAVFYLSLVVVVGVLAFRLRTDRGRPPIRFLAPILAILLFGALAVLTGRGLVWWALAAPVAMVSLQPGLRLADVRGAGLPRLRARTAREASAAEGRRSPLNAVIPTLLIVFALALLPLWRPAGPAGVPVLTLSYAPQGLAAGLDEVLHRRQPSGAEPPTRTWVPQTWASWFEFATPQVLVAVDSRFDVFTAEHWVEADQVATGKPGAIDILDRYRVQVVIVAAEQAALRQLLEQSNAWTRVYEDDEGAIWVYSAGR